MLVVLRVKKNSPAVLRGNSFLVSSSPDTLTGLNKKSMADGHAANIFVDLYQTAFLPNNRDNTNITRKIKKNILAIPADAPAIPPKPKIAAIIAIIKKTTV